MNYGDLIAALAWYGKQARLARLIHSGGDAGRHALEDDGGKRDSRAIAAWNTRTDAKAGSENTTAFLRDLAQRIFINATPQLGFDQGDVDRLYAIASVLADAPPVKQSLTSEGEEALSDALGETNTAIEKVAILSNQDWPLARLDMAATLDMIHEIAVSEIYPPARTDDAGQPSGDVAAMREALEWYADPDNWAGVYVSEPDAPMASDWSKGDYFIGSHPGAKARQAIAALQPEQGEGL